ncbi:hypothetical protein KBC04_04260 [Candidatus Babeliales bacterium]|nr:hypothetical protein [Candidatus Babeliales bacterium]MBP9844279.1 hypothetical protein [Candidatus Babeliales bacterium]
MLQKTFTAQQLSRFFQLAIFINILGLLSDVIVYRYFPNCIAMKITNENLSNVSILMICLTLIWQIIIMFIKKRPQFFLRYKVIGLSCLVAFCTFVYWFLNINNTIQERFIIFFSQLSGTNQSSKILLTVVFIFLMLLFNFYRNLTEPNNINDEIVPKILSSTLKIVIIEYVVAFIVLYGFFNIAQLGVLESNILNYNSSSILKDFAFLKTIIATALIFITGYHIYRRFFKK